MQKDRPVDWQDTNMSLFGSDIEKKCKAAAADSEPQWDDAGVKPGLQVWRIEQFRVKPWPKSKYGRFHSGDSYIILNTYVKEPDVNPDKLAWDVHFWIGSESTQDDPVRRAVSWFPLFFLPGRRIALRVVSSSRY